MYVYMDYYVTQSVEGMKGRPGAAVNLLPYDHEIMGSSPQKSLLQKCRENLRT
jgi:hypothetical protein